MSDHVDRLAGVDPLARPCDLPDGGASLRAPGVLAVATVTEQESLWATRRTHSLALQLAVGAQAAAVGSVLDRWLADVVRDPVAGDTETSAVVSVPSRDVALVAPLVARGFGPATVLAIRAFDRPDPAAWRRPGERPGERYRVRTATLDDAEWLVARSVDLQAWEAQFGYVPRRPDAWSSLAVELPQALARDAGWTWVAEDETGAVGFVQVNPPQAARWVNGATWLEPTGYVVGAYVAPEARSSGVGRTLAAIAHHRASEEGWAAMLLHHGATNPWSVPFWASLGYRPLTTTWIRRPAAR